MLSSRQVYAALSLLQLVYLSAGLALGKEQGGVVAELEEADKVFGWILDYRGLDEGKILCYKLMLVGIKNFQNLVFAYATFPSIKKWFFYLNDRSDLKYTVIDIFFLIALPLFSSHLKFNHDFFTFSLLLPVATLQMDGSKKSQFAFHALSCLILMWNILLIFPYLLLAVGFLVAGNSKSFECQSVILRLRMLGYLLRSQFEGFFKNNFGALLAAVFVGLGWALKLPFASKQVEEISEVEIKLASLGLQIISEFFFHTSVILASLPISVFETLSITTSFFWSPRLVERVLIVWTTFFVVSGIALYVYLHEITKWYKFVFHFCLGWSIFTLMVKKTRAFTNKRLIYSILAILGLIWSFACSAPGVIYILTFIFAGTSLITKFSYKPGKGFYAKLNALLEGIFFGPFMQQGLLLGYNCYLLSKIV